MLWIACVMVAALWWSLSPLCQRVDVGAVHAHKAAGTDVAEVKVDVPGDNSHLTAAATTVADDVYFELSVRWVDHTVRDLPRLPAGVCVPWQRQCHAKHSCVLLVVVPRGRAESWCVSRWCVWFGRLCAATGVSDQSP